MNDRSGTMTQLQSWSFQGRTGASSATFSPCGTYRYELRRAWDGTRPSIVVCALNCSTADATRDDPTVRRLISFAAREGAGALVVTNLFALRSPYPEDVYKHAEPIGPENDATLERIFSTHKSSRLILAWGAHGAFRGRGEIVGQMAMDLHGSPECFGLTNDGWPRHALYLPKNCPLQPWRPRKESSR